MSKRGFIAGVAAICVTTGFALSHRVEPGVSVRDVALDQDTAALKFIPEEPGPQPVALLAHGFAGSKGTLFSYGAALAAAGFICYRPGKPGYGAAVRQCSVMEATITLVGG